MDRDGEKQQARIIQLYDETSLEVRRLLYKKLGNHHEADEIAQDAFEKLCRVSNPGEIQDIRKYYFTMANRLALNALRRRNLESQYFSDAALDDRTPAQDSDNADPARSLAAARRLEVAKSVLLNLPSRTRHVFLLHRFEGQRYSDIAKQLGITQKAVEYHMHRALSALMAQLEPES